MRYLKEIRLLNLDLPSDSLLNDDLQFFSNCLGMFNKRDKEKSCFRIFVHLLEENESLSSDQLAEHSNLSRATVIHHLSKLIDSGLVTRKNNAYLLRFDKLEDLVEEIEKDVALTFQKLKSMSRKIDEEMDR